MSQNSLDLSKQMKFELLKNEKNVFVADKNIAKIY